MSHEAVSDVSDGRPMGLVESAAISIWVLDFQEAWAYLQGQGAPRVGLADFLECNPQAAQEALTRARALDVNPATLRMLGLARKDQLLLPLAEHQLPGLRQAWTELLPAVIEDDGDFTLEASLEIPGGRPLQVLLSCWLPRAGADLDSVVVCMTDITLQKQREQLLFSTQRMKMAVQLAGRMAHDFNNFLTVIGNSAAFLKGRFTPGEGGMRDVLMIEEASRQATILTDQLLAFARRQYQRPETIDLSSVVRDQQQPLQELAGSGVKLVTRLGSGLRPISADPRQLRLALHNLVTNAREAMPEGGRLTIETAAVELDSEYARDKLLPIPSGPYVMLSVNDTGSGMDADTQARAFEPFFGTRTPDKRAGVGIGMGLSTVYGFVKQNRGYVWLYSEPGLGTTIKLYFPGAEPGRRRSSTELQRRPTRATGRQPVTDLCGDEVLLLVEDDALVRRAARRTLERHGYQVLVASKGSDALEICEQHEGQIELMLTDLVMPNMTGNQLAEKVSKILPEMKVLYMSGHALQSMMHHGLVKHDAQYLQKPFTPEGMLRKIREVLDTD
jgi:signal transduction histidine kinase